MTQPSIDSIAPISRRAVAYLIDALIAGGIAIVGMVILYAVMTGMLSTAESLTAFLIATAIGWGVLLLVLLAWMLVYTAMQTKSGSIGMRTQGVRLASADDGMPIGFGRALLRNIVFGLSGWIVVGYFTPLFDSSGRFQGWHDKVANALVLDARKSPLPSTGARPAAASAPATTAMPVVPGVPGIPAADPAHGAFGDPSSGRFAAPAVPGVPSIADAPAAEEQTVRGAPAAASHGVPPVPIVPPGPVPPPGFGQPQPAQTEVPSAPPLPAPASFAVPQTPPSYEPPRGQATGAPIAYVPGVTQPGAPARAAEEDLGGLDPSLDVTVIQDRTPQPDPAASALAPAAAVAPASVPAPAPTATDDEIEATRISVPGHGLVFTWDDGVRMTVSRRTIFGRNPAPEDGAVSVSVRDETLSLSKTHFEAAAEVSGGWVLDRHSTNGMTIVRDGRRIACPPGQRVPVRLGDAIEIGDRIVTIGGYA